MTKRLQMSTCHTWKRHLLSALAAFVCTIAANAQTDYTSLITNPSFEKGTEGWVHQGMSAQGNNVFSIKNGNTYMERWTGRGGAGTAKVTSSLYLNSTAAAVKHICDDRQPNALFNDGGWGSDSRLSDGTYIPNCMTGAEKYFAKGLYDSSVSAQLETAGTSLRIGIKCTSAPASYWTMFDHFRLHFFGGGSTANGIVEVESQSPYDGTTTAPRPDTLYDMQGRMVQTEHGKKGIYITKGKKVVITR